MQRLHHSGRRGVIVGDGGVRLAVTEWGAPGLDRPTVLLVHGYPDTSAMWLPVAQRLAERHHVVAYDVRGAGDSSAPGGTSGYRLSHLVGDLVAVAEATSGGRGVHLVGHDWGSIQGWEAVSTDGVCERIASFTSLSAPGLDHAAAWAAARWRHPTPQHLRQLVDQQLRSWYVVAFHLPGAGLAWRAGLGRRWPQILERVEKVAPSDSYPAPTIIADGQRGIALYRANFGNRISHPRPRPTAVPVQVIVPTEDHFVSPSLSEGLERWVPRLWRSEVAGGHWLPRTDPDLVAAMVSELVGHIEGGAESPRLRRSRVSPIDDLGAAQTAPGRQAGRGGGTDPT